MRHGLGLGIPMWLAIGCTPAATAALPSLGGAALVRSDGRSAADSALRFTAGSDINGKSAAISTAVTGLMATLTMGDAPALKRMSLPLGDLDIDSGAMPPSGLALRDLSLTLASPMPLGIDSRGDDALRAHGTLLAELDWSIVLGDDSTHPLAPQTMAPLAATVVITRDDDGNGWLTIDGRCDGVC